MHADLDVFALQMVLLLGHNGGCDGEFTEAQLRRGWRVFRDELMERPGCRAGTRPWAFWAIERGMDSKPAYVDGVVLLAERGELSAGEVAEIERSGTGRPRAARGGRLLCTRTPCAPTWSWPNGCGRRSTWSREPVVTTKRGFPPMTHPNV